jgi:hypothetical protein
MDHEPISTRTVILCLLLASLGGAVKYIAAVLKSPEPVTNRRFWWLLAANMFVSSFCGLMGVLLVSAVTADPAWHGLTAGMFGYLGTSALDMVMFAMRKKIDPSASVASVLAVPPSVDSQPKA